MNHGAFVESFLSNKFLAFEKLLESIDHASLTAPSYLTGVALDFPLLATDFSFCSAYSKTSLEYIVIFVLSASSFS